MRVCFTTVLNDKFLKGFLITLNSIITSNPNFNYDIVIFEWGELSDNSKNLILKLYNKVFFKKVECELYKNHQYDNTWRNWTYNCNYRFDIFLLDEYDKVVFFDSDIIFELKFDDILKQNFDFGVCDSGEGNMYQFKGDKNFNAGFLVIGKKYINKKTREDLIRIAESQPPQETVLNTKYWTSDQPILNNYFADKATWLPNEYNFPIHMLNHETIKTPKNYHFSGPNKPWDSDKLEEQFTFFFFKELEKNTQGRTYLMKIVTNQLIKKYKTQEEILFDRGIDIKNINI